MSEKVRRCSLHILRCPSSRDILHWGESTDTSCNLQPKISYLQSCCWSKNFGSDSYLFPAFGFATSPETYRSIYHTNTRMIYACQLFDTYLQASEKHEPASGVAAGASGACKFCTSKITIESDGYPVTLPKTYFGPTHFSHLDGRSFSRRLSFHLSSQTWHRE